MPKTAAQTAADDRDGTAGSAPARQSAPFTFIGREVQLYEPTAGQQFILMQTIGITDDDIDDQERLELALGFAQMLRSLFAEPDERRAVTASLARGDADLEDYFTLATDMAEHWGIEREAPAANRQERRAATRRPVARPAGRGRAR